jgi:hypothetical protein|tara:strand:- start:30 stop:1421 length:1392 start_codon:yes stop_codon:yes gene_type:complete
MARFSGKDTETYTEVLAQVCLAYSIVSNKALTKQDLVSGSDLNPKVVASIKRYMVTQSSVNLTNKSFTAGFVEYIKGDVSKGLNWVDAQGRNMMEVKKRFKIGSGHKVYNDKLFEGGQSDNNPYTAFLKAKTGAKTDKWNPADIWVMNLAGRQALKKLNRRVQARTKVSLEYCNQFLAQQFSHGNIIPVSLKKPQKTPHIDIVNSNEFVTRVVLKKTNNPTIEYTYGNKDVKINFTIETVQLAKGQKASTARRNPNSIRGTVVAGSEKHIRLKYHVDNKKLELEYTQTGKPTRAAAKMGNIGAGNFQKIINETSKQGVNKLNNIERNYSDIDIKTSPWFNGRQLGVTKARKEVSKIEPHYDRLAEYVGEIWKEINNINFDSGKMKEPDALWSKARAGELGMTIHAISNESVKKRVIQNLFEAAASISYVTGLNKEEMALEQQVGMDASPRKTNFNASVYVKVF